MVHRTSTSDRIPLNLPTCMKRTHEDSPKGVAYKDSGKGVALCLSGLTIMNLLALL